MGDAPALIVLVEQMCGKNSLVNVPKFERMASANVKSFRILEMCLLPLILEYF